MNIIEVNTSNYTQYQNLDIVAFSFANPGAQGEGGGIKFVTSDKRICHTNYVKSISLDEAFQICPPLKDCNFALFDASPPTGWTFFYMGGGNFLVVKDQFKDTIIKTIPEGLYNHWIESLYQVL